MTDMTFNDRSTPFSLLATRRSGKPRDLIAPGPDAAELAQMLAIAARTPDHGKLAPWRFVIVPTAARARLAEVITTAYRAERPQAGATEIAALEQFAHQAPDLVVVLSSPRTESHIPLWEQELSAGAACMNLLCRGLADRLARLFRRGARCVRGRAGADRRLRLHRHARPSARRAAEARHGADRLDLARMRRVAHAARLQTLSGSGLDIVSPMLY